MINLHPTADAIKTACRKDYDNRYHKIRADLGYDAYSRIWESAVKFAVSQIAPNDDNIASMRALLVDAQAILAANEKQDGVSADSTIIALLCLLDVLDNPRSRAALQAPASQTPSVAEALQSIIAADDRKR